jgi:hypothetical protein
MRISSSFVPFSGGLKNCKSKTKLHESNRRRKKRKAFRLSERLVVALQISKLVPATFDFSTCCMLARCDTIKLYGRALRGPLSMSTFRVDYSLLLKEWRLCLVSDLCLVQRIQPGLSVCVTAYPLPDTCYAPTSLPHPQLLEG